MKVTIVIFKAFDKTCNESFIHNETSLQIHNALATFCPTYEPLNILEADETEPVSLNTLNQFKL